MRKGENEPVGEILLVSRAITSYGVQMLGLVSIRIRLSMWAIHKTIKNNRSAPKKFEKMRDFIEVFPDPPAPMRSTYEPKLLFNAISMLIEAQSAKLTRLKVKKCKLRKRTFLLGMRSMATVVYKEPFVECLGRWYLKMLESFGPRWSGGEVKWN